MLNFSVSQAKHWDIFCAVIDNYGDIGVTWRLARQLADEYQLEVRLWVDDLGSFSHILPQLDPQQDKQVFYGVTIIHWRTPLPFDWQPGKVLIEAFACELPTCIQNQLEQNKPDLCWLNLEYLTAEDWVEGCHGVPSRQLSLNKYFFFPGFTEKTGGLICESQLQNQRKTFQQTTRAKHLDSLGVPVEENAVYISLFSYENPAISTLVNLWRNSSNPVHLLLPKGRGMTSVAKAIKVDPNKLNAGDKFILDNLNIHILGMTDQQGYDHLLWCSDINIVRGEDSFLRAQWAGRPFIWHIYPQDENEHLIKLQAFMDKYCEKLPNPTAKNWQNLNLAFNRQNTDKIQQTWKQVFSAADLLQKHAENWPIDAINSADLAMRLVNFVKNR